jgi:ribosome hibernation promoting factor
LNERSAARPSPAPRRRAATPILIEYTGRHTEVPARLRALSERKLRKLAKRLPGITRVHVILATDKHRQIAEVSAHSPLRTITAVQESDDLGVSLATAVEKLARQAQRHVGRRRRWKRGPGERAAAAGPAPPARKRSRA